MLKENPVKLVTNFCVRILPTTPSFPPRAPLYFPPCAVISAYSTNVFFIVVSCVRGKVIEEGNHDDLLIRKGAYSQLMSTQVRSFSTIAD